MSTLVEFQDAVAQLPGDERKALHVWLNSQAESGLTAPEEQRLLRSLDEAVRHIAKDDSATAVRIGNELMDRVEIPENFRGSVRCMPSVPACVNWFSCLTSLLSSEAGGKHRGHPVLLARRPHRAGVAFAQIKFARENLAATARFWLNSRRS